MSSAVVTLVHKWRCLLVVDYLNAARRLHWLFPACFERSVAGAVYRGGKVLMICYVAGLVPLEPLLHAAIV